VFEHYFGIKDHLAEEGTEAEIDSSNTGEEVATATTQEVNHENFGMVNPPPVSVESN
jgi:hypothetical protein